MSRADTVSKKIDEASQKVRFKDVIAELIKMGWKKSGDTAEIEIAGAGEKGGRINPKGNRIFFAKGNDSLIMAYHLEGVSKDVPNQKTATHFSVGMSAKDIAKDFDAKVKKLGK